MNIPAARELGAIGVRLNAIARGLFMTTMVAALCERVLASLKEQMEAPKRLGDMREFAHCCAFVIENAYLNAKPSASTQLLVCGRSRNRSFIQPMMINVRSERTSGSEEASGIDEAQLYNPIVCGAVTCAQ